MISPLLMPDPDRLPRPADASAVETFMHRWSDAAKRAEDPELAAFAAAVSVDAAGAALLGAVSGNSPFLANCLVGDPAFARDLFTMGPDHLLTDLLAKLQEPGIAALSTAEVMHRLRVDKRRAALAIGLADIAGAWGLEQVTDALSRIAEGALHIACAHLLMAASGAGELALAHPDDPERESGLIVLGMGKLGASELNYSSDIDLIILFEPDRIEYTGKDSPQQCFVRLARNLVRIMDQRTRDGYVFRTDLRLRPDPGSTPPAMSAMAAEVYYESTGQNWERAAMIKARPVAGDGEAGARFLDNLRPFLWRKNLDFAAIEDIHSIKRQINAHRGGAEIAVAGHNIKLGRGGIREIEFFVQTQQLIWGGRDPRLRLRGTRAGLRALVASGRVEAGVADDLDRAYRFLRRLEHRLQMIDDQQTHRLPEDEAPLEALAAFMGYAGGEAFAGALLTELRTVESVYAVLFEDSPDLGGPGNLVFTGSDDDPETLATLAGMGFREPSIVSATIRAWHHGRYRATRSARARELMTELVPTILQSAARTISPDSALLRFDGFLQALPAGVQLFSLFHNNPGLFDLVAEIMGSAPRLAEWLSRHPILLDGVLTQGFFDPVPGVEPLADELSAALNQARDFQDVLDVVRRWTNDRLFQVGVQILHGKTEPGLAGGALTDIADVGLRALLPEVERAFAAQHGEVAGGGMAVVACGKLGGRELTVGSDLDLLFIYDVPAGIEASDGPKPLPPALYFARLSQRFINAVTAPTGEGRLYEVDMRLRPSGSAGPIATSLEAFRRYHRDDAWTWERMAVTRARVVCGPPELSERIETAVRETLTQPRDGDMLLVDVADMRLRIAREHRPDDLWNVKHYRGGLVDIEFIAQYLQLRHAAGDPGVLSPNTTAALERLAAADLLDRDVARELIASMRLWRNVQGVLRLTVGEPFDEDGAPEGLRAALARSAGADDFASLRAEILATAARAYDHFAAIVENPAATGSPP